MPNIQPGKFGRHKVFAILVVALLATSSAFCQGDEPVSTYKFKDVKEEIRQPWHKTYLPDAATPAGQPNAGADYINNFLGKAFAGKLEKSAVRKPWQTYSKFFNWAVWGYLSPDSKYRNDKRLIEMSRTWLEGLLKRLTTKPENPKKAKNWTPGKIGDFWGFADYTIPLLAVEAHPKLKVAIGDELCAKYRQIVIASIEAHTTPAKFNRLIAKAENYVNMATHPMAVYVHGWLLTGEEKYLRMAQSIVAILHRDQMPNGMFPYRMRLGDKRHLEFETMYYRAIEIRALYLYWWATKSPMAEECLERSKPWYPLNLEPPYHFNAGPDIWWKDQWRTFWSMHVAMTAAATQDGENATIARAMAKDGKSRDRFDLVLGALAFNQMAKIEAKPVRDNYVVHDPDIRGLRLRAAPWSSTFTVGSFTYTRVSAMRVHDSGKNYDALHMARPFLRVDPLYQLRRYDFNYSMLGPAGGDFTHVIQDDVGAVCTVYKPALTPKTWRPVIPQAPLQVTELWLMTPQGLIGLIDSLALEDKQAYEFNHQFRFIVNGKKWEADEAQKTWHAGTLDLRIWHTDFPHHVVERVRRYALAPQSRNDYQLSLLDQPRVPEEIAQAPKNKDKRQTKEYLPKKITIPAGYRRQTLASITPRGLGKVTAARKIDHDALVGFECRVGDKTYEVLYNPTKTAVTVPAGNGLAERTVPPGKIGLTLTE